VPIFYSTGGDILALKIVLPCCCGIGVHKHFLVACIASTDNKGTTTYMYKRFSTFTGDLRKLSQWLATTIVVMFA
jgi:hypothetical protein